MVIMKSIEDRVQDEEAPAEALDIACLKRPKSIITDKGMKDFFDEKQYNLIIIFNESFAII
jgi:hypothetical protein